jgi:FMN-dependent NADH-azoreductase
MREAKDRELLMVSRKFELYYENIMKLLPSESNSLKQEIEKIEQLKKFYKIVEAFPVWPFNYQNVLRFFASVISPFLLAIVPSILSLIV